MSGGWDPEAGERRRVRLPGLTQEQMRRPEYFYSTDKEVEERMAKLRVREEKLAAKRRKLAQAKARRREFGGSRDTARLVGALSPRPRRHPFLFCRPV